MYLQQYPGQAVYRRGRQTVYSGLGLLPTDLKNGPSPIFYIALAAGALYVGSYYMKWQKDKEGKRAGQPFLKWWGQYRRDVAVGRAMRRGR